MADFLELRVHGVSGTPPRDMLYTDPVKRESIGSDGPSYTDVYERASYDEEYDANAFHWGGLTTGSPWTAFWILLAPFAFANVAGWMARRPHRFGRAMVRCFGVALTALFAAQAFTVVVLLPLVALRSRDTLGIFSQRLDIEDWVIQAVAVVLTYVAARGFYWLISRASTQSHFSRFTGMERRELLMGTSDATMLPPQPRDDESCKPIPSGEDQWDDPARQPCQITNRKLWEPQSVVHRLRRLNLGAGWATISFLLALITGRPAVQLTIGATLIVLLLSTVAITFWPMKMRYLSRWAPYLGLSALFFSAGSVLAVSPGLWDPSAGHRGTFMVSAAIGLLAVLSATSGLLTLGALVIATQLGAVLGLAAGMIMESFLGVEDTLIENGAGWVAVAMLFLILWLAIVALITSLRRDQTPGTPDLPNERPSRGLALARRVEIEGRSLFYAAAAFGIGALIAVVVGRFRSAGLDLLDSGTLTAERITAVFDPAGLPTPEPVDLTYVIAIAAAGLVLLGLTILVWYGWGWSRAVWIPVGAAIIVGLAAGGFLQVEFGRLTVILRDDLIRIALTVAILIPGFFMLRSVWTGFREGEAKRRRVGILWDIGSFWPRWFHPLAPPAYGPVAVTNLRCELEKNPVDVVAAHSQGSLIAAVALTQSEEEAGNGRAFITYGSQLGILYPRMFPAVGMTQLVRDAYGNLGGRWRNLWRSTDPIGGHYVDILGDEGNLLVETGTGHSGYELTPEYEAARSELAPSAGELPDTEQEE